MHFLGSLGRRREEQYVQGGGDHPEVGGRAEVVHGVLMRLWVVEGPNLVHYYSRYHAFSNSRSGALFFSLLSR